ncbi:hypothetical protein ACFYST_21055 [Kitasatospora sp. NPDC004614]|uniref:hypothetical protein n=1 Tax=unclassified Kitasatospora TaxID=2633591 RepID=UPI0036BE248C
MLVRQGIRSWRGQTPSTFLARSLAANVLAGGERALLVLGACGCFLGAMIGLGGYLSAAGVIGGTNPPPPAAALVVVLLILLVGVVTTSLTGIAIVWYNRPRFLVPPHLRDQPGIMSVR